MKRKWEEPKIKINEFAANEYVAACYIYTETGIVVDNWPTDGKLEIPNKISSWNKTGFQDDGFDFLAGDDDTIPSNGNGWYGNNQSLDHIKKGSLNPIYGSYGNHAAPNNVGMANPVYFFGKNWPTQITSTNYKQYGVGPNAS